MNHNTLIIAKNVFFTIHMIIKNNLKPKKNDGIRQNNA